MKKALYISILAASVALAGCGGGGGGSASAPVATNPSPSAPVAPVTPTPPVSTVQPAALQTAAAATYAAGSRDEAAFSSLNAFRVSMGLGPLLQSANIDLAAKNHSAYVTTNQTGADPHNEVQGKPGFTGATATDRVRAAGYAADWATEVISFGPPAGNTQWSAIDNLVNTVYHRAAMMYQGMTHVGVAPETDTSPLFVNIAVIKPQVNAGDYVGVYPTPNKTGVWLTHGVESPNPFYLEMEMTQDNMCTKTSSPVSVTSEASTALSVTNFTVTEEGQTAPLAARIITQATSDQDKVYLTPNIAVLVGKAPFKPNTKYNVSFVGKATGKATGSATGLVIEKTWSFTTGSYKRGCL
jgi:uncharacterized protein YkwD